MITSPTTRTQTERADQTRTRILAAAIRQFSENGLAGARTEQIAEAAGVNKALLYYYFRSKEDLYSAAMETIAEGVHASSMAVLDIDASAGERFLRLVLNHFDRIHSNRVFQSLMQQEMIRLHRGEVHTLGPLVEKLFRPLWIKVQSVVEEGIAAGELIPAEQTQIIYAGLGANVFYFLSAPMMRLARMSTSWNLPLSAFVARQPSNTWARPSSLTGSTDHASPPRCWPPRPCRNRRNSKPSKSRTARTKLPQSRQLM